MSKKTKPMSPGCLALFLLPFILIGAFILWLSATQWWMFVRAQGWRQVPAQVEHAEFIVTRGSKSTSARVEARYRYTADGREYVGSRVGLQKAASDGDFHHERFELLDTARRDAVPFPIWVNPSDATESIAFRGLTWIQFALPAAGLVFFGSPLLVLRSVLKTTRRQSKSAQRTPAS